MLVVNLFGAPGAGKSTGAAYVFSKLKMNGINAELVTEYVKDKLYEGRDTAVFQNQCYVFGKQFFRISRLDGQVDVVVTDSPVLLASFYNKDADIQKPLDELAFIAYEKYPSFNAFITRNKPYNPSGRFQTEAQSDAMVSEIHEFLNKHGVACRHYNGDLESYDVLVSDMLKMINDGRV